MADFTSTMTKAATVTDHQISVFNEGVIIAAQEELIVNQLISQKKTQEAKDFNFTVYSNLAAATTSLTDGEDPTSVALSDDKVTITPVEKGNVVTITRLADLQNGGIVKPTAVKLVGSNMGQSIDKLGILALEAATNELIVTQATEAELTASDVITEAYFNKVYNKLRRANIPKINGSYFAVLHPDVIEDLKDNSSAGSWMDTIKYTDAMPILRNEVGMFKGFRVLENSNITINTDVGAGAVDTYHSLFLGYNALGYAESQAPAGVISGPFDKLQRFLNLGWYGVFAYGIVDSNAIWKVTSASSYGAN